GGVEEDRRVSSDFRDRGSIRRDHRGAAGKRLDDGEAEALVEAREDEGSALAIERREILIGDDTEVADTLADAELVRRAEEIEARLGSDEDGERRMLRESAHRLEDHARVLPLLECADREEERLRE